MDADGADFELRSAARGVHKTVNRSHTEQDAPFSIWQALVEGRWALVDAFDADGRRFIVAREVRAFGGTPCGLTARDQQIVAYRAGGHGLKHVAHELGLSLSTVSRRLASAMRSLGVRTNADLARLFSVSEATGRSLRIK